MITKIKQLEVLTQLSMIEILNLWETIPDLTCTKADYAKYIIDYFDDIGIFVVEIEGSIEGFLHVEPPHPLEPRIGYMSFAVSGPKCGHKNALRAVRMAERWLADKGADSWRMETVRNCEALQRLWGLKETKEKLMVKKIGY